MLKLTRRLALALALALALSLLACGAPPPEQTPPASPTADLPSALGDGGVSATADAGPGGDAPVKHPQQACEPTSPRAQPTEVYALPEAGEAPFEELLSGAKSSIRVMVYLMGYGGILDALKAKAQAGVSVRVILDKGQADTNQKYFDQLTAAGATVLWSDPKFPYMHAKVIIVDGAHAMVSTGNFSKSYSIELERNFAARVSDPDDVADLTSLFEADWKRAAPELSCTRLLVSPVNARARLLALIDSAKSTLTVESMQLADSDVRAHLAARKAAGVEVRAILADASWISANADAAKFLKGLGVEPRSIPHCHVKAIVVDGQRAYLGSENLSYTSLSKNREVGLIVTEPAAVKTMVDTFEKDWGVGVAF